MAEEGVKISELPAADSIADTDEIELNQSGISRKGTAAQLRAGLAPAVHSHTLSDISDAGTAAGKNVGTGVGNVLELEDVGGKAGLPAVDGSQLTGLPGGGDMTKGVYDPQEIEKDAFDRANHTGTQTLATISDAKALAAKDTVGAGDIENNAVTTLKIADEAVTKAKLNSDVFETVSGVREGTATDAAINAAMLRYFAGLCWPLDSRSGAADFTKIEDQHAGALIKTDRDMTLSKSFASRLTFMLWNVDTSDHKLTVEAGDEGTGKINGKEELIIAAGGMVVVVVESNAGDEPQGAAFGDVMPQNILGAVMPLEDAEETASFTLSLEHAQQKMIRCNHASTTIAVTIPAHASVPFPLGTTLYVMRWGDAHVTFGGAEGVTLHSAVDGTPRIARKFGVASLWKQAENVWVCYGLLEEAPA